MAAATVGQLTEARDAAEAVFRACWAYQLDIRLAVWADGRLAPNIADDPAAWRREQSEKLQTASRRLADALTRDVLDAIELHACATLAPIETYGEILPTAHQSACVVLAVTIHRAEIAKHFSVDNPRRNLELQQHLKSMDVFDPQEHLARLKQEWSLAVNGVSQNSDSRPELSDSQQAIVDVIRESDKRLTKREILAVLSAKGLQASEGVTGQTLAFFTQFGVLTNTRDAHGKGYGLPEWSKS